MNFNEFVEKLMSLFKSIDWEAVGHFIMENIDMIIDIIWHFYSRYYC